MADADEGLKIKPAVLVGKMALPYRDPGIKICIPDVITECRFYDGILALSLGSFITVPMSDGSIAYEVEKCASLRISKQTLQNLQSAIAKAISDEAVPDKTGMN